MTRLLICSKSRWSPAIRREHELAKLAAAAGHEVVFLERPADVREWRGAGWLRALVSAGTEIPGAAGVRTMAQATLVPGHRRGAETLSALQLRRAVVRGLGPGDVVVANVPWQWPALAGLGARRVFDCADDWSVLLPGRAARMRELYARIGVEADAVITVSDALAALFGGRGSVVPNGVADAVLGPPAPSPRVRRLVYVGTLSPRFDAPLAAAVLRALPDWRLDLYGQCQYPGSGEQPGAELRELLGLLGERVAYHGVVERSRVAAAIDAADVACLFNRAGESAGQDSMKLYDYAARGRPIVASVPLRADPAVCVRVATGARELAAAVIEGFAEPADAARERRAWAEGQRWERRWEQWARAALAGE
jgi:glycosyltransferase involved in cell wall biosynthesis